MISVLHRYHSIFTFQFLVIRDVTLNSPERLVGMLYVCDRNFILKNLPSYRISEVKLKEVNRLIQRNRYFITEEGC